MNQITKPIPVDREVQWNNKQLIESKIDLSGNIISVNDAFEEVSEYENHELVGKPIDLLCHPEMPTIINKLLWENIKNENRFFCITKNISKSGRYFWIIQEYQFVKDETGTVMSYINRSKEVSQSVIKNHIQPLYRKLFMIEKASGLELSKQYLVGFLEDVGYNYVDYLSNLIANDGNEINDVDSSWYN